MEHDERYRRAREFYDVVTGLWDSFAEDAFIRDVDDRALISTPNAVHVLDHKGEFLKVRGPAEYRPPDSGLAGHRPGRRLGGWPAACRGDGGSHLRQRQLSCRGAALLTPT